MRERQKSGGVRGTDGADRNHRNRRGHLRGAPPTQACAPPARSPGISQGLGPQADPMPAWPRRGGAARLRGSPCGTRPWPDPSLQGHLVHSAWVGAARVAVGGCCPARVCTGALRDLCPGLNVQLGGGHRAQAWTVPAGGGAPRGTSQVGSFAAFGSDDVGGRLNSDLVVLVSYFPQDYEPCPTGFLCNWLIGSGVCSCGFEARIQSSCLAGVPLSKTVCFVGARAGLSKNVNRFKTLGDIFRLFIYCLAS